MAEDPDKIKYQTLSMITEPMNIGSLQDQLNAQIKAIRGRCDREVLLVSSNSSENHSGIDFSKHDDRDMDYVIIHDRRGIDVMVINLDQLARHIVCKSEEDPTGQQFDGPDLVSLMALGFANGSICPPNGWRGEHRY